MSDLVDGRLAAAALDSARRSGDGWFRADCPYCLEETGKADRRRSLGIKPSISFFVCFKCGTRGRLRDEDLDGLALDDVKAPELPAELGPPEGCEPIWPKSTWDSITMAEPVEYLKRRGIGQVKANHARLGVCLTGYFGGRIVAPCLDLDGTTWLGFSARDYTGKQEPKYRYPRGMQRAKFLYNQVALYEETDVPVMIVEGVFDALPYWPDCVACLGKPGDVHRQLLGDATITRPMIVCLDGDSWEEAWYLSEYLKLSGRRSGYVRLPPKTDPGSVDPRWLFQEVIKCIQ